MEDILIFLHNNIKPKMLTFLFNKKIINAILFTTTMYSSNFLKIHEPDDDDCLSEGLKGSFYNALQLI